MTAEKNDHRPEAAGKPEDLGRAEWFCSWLVQHTRRGLT
jgi:hypothetical protein